jgi:hypothetical protein
MAKKYGKALTNVLNGDGQSRAPGSSYNAAQRVMREVFDLSLVAAGDDLVLSKPRGGDVLLGWKITGSVDLSGMTMSIGNATSAVVYMTATAGPATPGVPKEVGLAAAIDDDPLPDSVEVLGRLGGVVPGAGILVVLTLVSHR